MRLVILVVFMVGLSSCTTTTGQYNTEDKQDGSCYAKYGGLRGYCNATGRVK